MIASNNSMIVSERFRGRVQGPVNKVCILFYPLKLKQNDWMQDLSDSLQRNKETRKTLP